jgi:hypothetical protein
MCVCKFKAQKDNIGKRNHEKCAWERGYMYEITHATTGDPNWGMK